MDIDSIKRLGLASYTTIDVEASDEFYDPSTNNHTILIRLKKAKIITCPNCGLVNNYYIRSSRITKIKHSSEIEHNINLKLIKRVYLCKNCDSYFTEDDPFKVKQSSYTKEKIYDILFLLKDKNQTFKSISDTLQISQTKVINIFDTYVNIDRQPFSKVICMDEVYTKHCSIKKFCNVSFDPINNKILDVLPSRNLDDLIAYYSKIPHKERDIVEAFSIDLYEPYRQLAKICFPQAKICADHFHVIKNLQKFFNQARIRIMKKYESLKCTMPENYWLYKNYWKLLFKNPDKLSWKRFKVRHSGMVLNEHEIVIEMLTLDKDLEEAYNLLAEYKEFNAIAKPSNAKNKLDELIMKFENSKLPEMIKGYKLLKNWYQEIINSYELIDDKRISNGNIERVNKNIKDLIRLSYGYRNFYRFRNRILYILNDDSPIKYIK